MGKCSKLIKANNLGDAKKRISYPAEGITGYALRFVISHRAFDVMTFEKREIFETDHS